MGLPSNTNALQNGFAQGYQIGRSLRFRSSASAYLTRTPSVAGNQQKWTWSAWVKRGALGVAGVVQNLLTAGTGDNARTLLFFQDNNTLNFVHNNTGTYYGTITTAVFRDCSAWYHILVSVDTTQATATNRVRIYINSVEQTATSTFGSGYVQQNTNTYINSTNPQVIGANPPYSSIQFLDGYLAEVNLIDGQQLTPSSFGVYDSNGIWQPIKYTGTYGTNGFYLPFSNTTSTTTLVADASGNGNNWTANNISLTSGSTYDSMIDSPTVSSVSSNYCVWNAIAGDKNISASGGSITNGNLYVTASGGASDSITATGTITFLGGKYYGEITCLAAGSGGSQTTYVCVNAIGSGAAVYLAYEKGGQYYNGSTWTAGWASWTTNDVIGLAVDQTTTTISVSFYKNNVLQGTLTYATGTTALTFATRAQYNASFSLNCGQQPFTYTPPSGYNALNTANLSQPLISNGANYMAATLITGTGGSQTLNNGTNTTIGTTFQPDLVWWKSRSNVTNNILVNSITGVNPFLRSNTTGVEDTPSGMTSFNSNGFSVNGSFDNTYTFVAWQWKAGAGTTSTNTSGSITSTVSVSAQSGFSVVTYTGTGVNNATVGHGLGVTPNMIILKDRDSNSVNNNWQVYHSSLTSGNFLYLNTTDAQSAISGTSYGSVGNPSSTIFTCVAGSVSSATTNESGDKYVAYCFAAVRGYSAFSSYSGNGSADGPFCYLGFRPRYVMIKRTDSANWWLIWDSSRNTYNVLSNYLLAQDSAGENNSGASPFDYIDALSNGFKIRSNGISVNASGGTYIYAAFAESPFQISRAR